jgi:hypothetical protein
VTFRLLHTAGSVETVLRRFERLTPGTPGRWGRLDAPHMQVHVTDQLRLALGELPAGPPIKLDPVTLALKDAIITFLPWPRNLPNRRDAARTEPTDWRNDRARLTEVMQRFTARPLDSAWAPHPMFGPLSGRAWSRLGYRHLDYHLTQFGV